MKFDFCANAVRGYRTIKWRYSFSGNQGKLFTKETGHLPVADTMTRLFIDTMM